MSSVYAVIGERDFSRQLVSPVALTVQQYTTEADGGPADATVIATGDDTAIWSLIGWLRGPLDILHPETGPVWWGYINDIEITVGEITVGISLDAMHNRLQIVYNEPAITGASERKETAWAQDDESVAAYGVKEVRLSVSDIPTAIAEARRTTELLRRARPQPTPPAWGGSATTQAVLRAKGWRSTLNWRYYGQAAGLIAHAVSGSTVHKIGLGVVDTTIGFSSDRKAIHDIAGRLQPFKKGDQVRISGATSNDGTYTVEQGTSRAAVVLTATTISFAIQSGQSRILDSAKQLAPFDAGDMLKVEGAGVNSGIYRVVSGASDGSWVQVDRAITVAAAGASITIRRGNHIIVAEILTNEDAGATVTLQSAGDALRQSFSTPSGGWTVGALGVRARIVGSPADSLRLSLYSNASGNPGSQLDTGVLAAASIPTALNWVTRELSNTVALASSTLYHLVVERTGALSLTDYYEVAVDEDLGYSDGELRLRVGGTWSTAHGRTPDADLCFRVLGYRETTAQIADIVAACGQFFTGVDIVTASGLAQPQYRDGRRSAAQELAELLAHGTSTGRRLLASVTADRVLRITAEADPAVADHYRLGLAGRLRGPLDQDLPHHLPITGVWADIDVIPAEVARGVLASATVQFIERCTIDAGSGRVQFGFRNQTDLYDLGGIQDG